MIKYWLTRLGLWIARFGYWPPERVIARARVLCLEWETSDSTSEYKRHQVYAKLIKEFPTLSRRMIGLAIELSLIV